MGKLLESISKNETEFIMKQKVFFVATAPLSKDHHVNVSPKSPGTSIIVLDPHTVAYCDLTGSGAETAAHILENERMTILFCNIEEGKPKILRLHGTAQIIVIDNNKKHTTEEQFIINKFPKELISSFGFRAIYILNVHRISSSCGYSLPIMKFEKYRNTLEDWTCNRGEKKMQEYCITKNSFSIDGLPSLAILRNKDLNIIQNPEEGYIYGKVVNAPGAGDNNEKKNRLLSSASIRISTTTPKEKKICIKRDLFFMFAGAIVGSTILLTFQSFKGTKSRR